MLNEKVFWKSKEFWVFLVIIAQGVAGLLGFLDLTPTQDQTENAQIIVAMVGMILRLFFTEKRLVLSRNDRGAALAALLR